MFQRSGIHCRSHVIQGGIGTIKDKITIRNRFRGLGFRASGLEKHLVMFYYTPKPFPNHDDPSFLFTKAKSCHPETGGFRLPGEESHLGISGFGYFGLF